MVLNDCLDCTLGKALLYREPRELRFPFRRGQRLCPCGLCFRGRRGAKARQELQRGNANEPRCSSTDGVHDLRPRTLRLETTLIHARQKTRPLLPRSSLLFQLRKYRRAIEGRDFQSGARGNFRDDWGNASAPSFPAVFAVRENNQVNSRGNYPALLLASP